MVTDVGDARRAKEISVESSCGFGLALRLLQLLPYSHRSIRCTPAMEAGITGHIRALKELLEG
jgi:hypothetical protein